MSNHPYLPHTPEDIGRMLDRCGAKSLDDLYSDVPSSLRLSPDGYDLPAAKSEEEIRRAFAEMLDNGAAIGTCLAGNGFYDHYTPAVIPYLLQRSEFQTAYTPYQPEISQGTLQYIFEYQSMMCALTGMDVCNASMYDGCTATAEAAMMMVNAARKKRRVLLSATLLPAVAQVVATYARYHKIQIDTIPCTQAGVTDLSALDSMLAQGDVAGIILPTPNRFGIIEDYTGVADKVHAAKALLAINCVATTLAVLRTPGQWGADIAVGDAQSLGLPLNYGGPNIGFMCCTKALMRKLPGRIVGATTDEKGQRVFVLTLQAREQHIRREKATSNICSNQGLMSLFVTIYMSLMGPKGLKEVNVLSADGAHYLAKRLQEEGVGKLRYPDSPFLNEFVLDLPEDFDRDMFLQVMCMWSDTLMGVAVEGNSLMIAVTEKHDRKILDEAVEAFCNYRDGNLFFSTDITETDDEDGDWADTEEEIQAMLNAVKGDLETDSAENTETKEDK